MQISKMTHKDKMIYKKAMREARQYMYLQSTPNPNESALYVPGNGPNHQLGKDSRDEGAV